MIKNRTINSDEFILFNKCLIFYLLLSSEEKLDIKTMLSECKKRMNAFIGKRTPQYLTSTLKLNEKFDINTAVDNISILLDTIEDSITNNEIAFIKSFPNISIQLFENDIINKKIARHPMIRWKQSLLK